MKTLLVIHVILVFMAIIKANMAGLRIKREYIITKSNMGLLEKMLRKLYYIVIYCIPLVSLFILFISEDEIIEKVTKDFVKKDN